MSKELKSKIEKAEEEDKSRAYMEKTIDGLKIEIASLKKKIENKKPSFKVTPIRHFEEKDESEKNSILKNMINSLKQEINQNEKEKEVLQEKVNKLTLELKETNENLSDSVKNDLYLKTQNSLNNLIQDYERLEKDNIKLIEKIAQLNDQVDESTKQVSILLSKDSDSENLKESAEVLNQEIEALKNKNQELEHQNRILNENLDALKREKLKISVLETSVLEMNLEIDNLRKVNKDLRDKHAILLAKTINVMSVSKIDRPSQTETQKLESEPDHEPEQESITEIRSELETITSNLDVEIKKEILIEEKETITDLLLESEQNIIKEDVEEISTETDSENEITRKWQCPNCGNTNKFQIREQDDKTRIIYNYPRIYGKKYRCGQCGKEWR